MDNLTHSLLGAAVAEVYIEQKFKNSAFRPPKNIFYFFSIFANNCPDLDLLFGLIDNSQLGYLLNHRGWTHTVAGTLPQSLLLIGISWFWVSFVRRELRPYLKDMALLIFIGMQTHMGLDYLNTYGVHPFAPLVNKWFYMDSIFIIEPLLWFALLSIWLPPWGRRVLWLVPPLAAYAYGWWNQLVPMSVLFVVTVLAVSVFSLQAYLLKVYRGVVGLILFCLVIFVFWEAQHLARQRVMEEIPENLDVVLYSMPSNPTCWFFLVPQVSGEQYSVLHGSISLIGESRGCRAWPKGTDVDTAASEPGALGPLWIRKKWQASLKDLQPILHRCDVQAWFQFARVPIWENSILNDLRFAARSGKNLTTFDVNREPVCPVLTVPWQPPRQDLIDLVKALPVN